MINLYFEPFIIPFCIGLVALFAVMWSKFISWISVLPKADRKRILRRCFTLDTLLALKETFAECLLHLRIRKINLRLWYMHTSLAFGWFLLIVVGKIEGVLALGSFMNPPYVDIFFRKYFPYAHVPFVGFLMDLLLLFILSGVVLAVEKRFRSTSFGMKKTIRHHRIDRIALMALWAIFPLRLLAESFNSAIFDSGSFLTGSIGTILAYLFPDFVLSSVNEILWWLYSISLGVFFALLPLSRYLHIFAEIPLIFLRSYGVRARENPTTFTKLQMAACSRCGICINTCQLASSKDHSGIQPAYFLRSIRGNCPDDRAMDSCLLCGRCEQICPVNLELNKIRISSRYLRNIDVNKFDYSYFSALKVVAPLEKKVGYFAGCMGLLNTKTLSSMRRIFEECGEDVWWADLENGVCCGRPQKMKGNLDAARQMMEYNKKQFEQQHITLLVTSCPICLKTFKEEYALEGIEVIHHTQYIARLLQEGRITRAKTSLKFSYHDPCELGRGLGVYDEPRQVITTLGQLCEIADKKEDALCCGFSLGSTTVGVEQRIDLARRTTQLYDATASDYLVTSCPLCKRALSKSSQQKVVDLSEALFLES